MEKVWSNEKRFYPPLRKNLVFFPFFPFYPFQAFANNSNRFSVVVKRPPLHFLGDLSQALLRELARAKLLHTSRTCST